MPDSLRIGFLSAHDPFDRSAFSGTAFHMRRALIAAKGIDVRILGGHRPRNVLDRLLRRSRGKRVIDTAALDLAGLDAVLALTATGYVARLLQRTDIPLVHLTDATPAFLRDFYGRDVDPEAAREEGEVVRKAALTVYSSHYMAACAASEFGAPPDRLAAVPFGVNFDSLPGSVPPKQPLDPVRLLWVGSKWERKGGDIALATLDRLRAGGIAATLDLVGNVPEGIELPEGARRVGYLDKERSREAARLTRLFSEAHLFLLPTRADCTPMVLAEANAHGTPVLVTETGGIGSLVEEGKSGRMLPMSAGPEDWAAAIREMTADPEAHAALCRSSFEHAHVRLSWDAWARDVTALLRERVV